MKFKKSEYFSYDSNRKHLLCRGRIALLQTLKLMLPSEINIKKSLRDVRMAGYVDTKGKPHVFKNYPLLFTYLEKECGLPIIANKCFITGVPMANPLFTIVLKSIPDSLLEVEVEEESIVQAAPVAVVESIAPAKVLDIEYAKSLNNDNDKAGSKKALAEYADGFGITLKQNKKFEDMILDLEQETKAE